VLVWFALVPLFCSLARHPTRARQRLGHALAFGATFCATTLFWFFPAFLDQQGSGLVGWISAGALCVASWGSLCLFWALFALAAGPLFRARNRAFTCFALPLLWTGIEILRASLGWPWVNSWLALGYGIAAPHPEALVSEWFGVYGLTFALVFTATGATLLVTEPRLRRQPLWALAACAAPAACFGFGLAEEASRPHIRTIPIGAVAHERGSLPGLMALTSSLAEGRPTCVVWPQLQRDDASVGQALELPVEFGNLLAATGMTVVTAAGRERGDRNILVLGGEGAIAATRTEPGPTANYDNTGHLPIYTLGESRFGVAEGFDFLTPQIARELRREDAELLVLSSGSRAAWSVPALEWEANCLAFRARENRCWLVSASSAGVFTFGPKGRRGLRLLSGVDGAGTDDVEAIQGQSPYANWGWWLEPLALGLAAWLLGWSAWSALAGRTGVPASRLEPSGQTRR